MRRSILVMALVVAGGCTQSMSPELLSQYGGRTLYTCCNLHHETDSVSDANYFVGQMLPLGTPAQVQAAGRGSVTFLADGQRINLVHSYGTQQESFQQYLDKILVPDDPKVKLGSYAKAVQEAIRDSRVEVGMTKDQVLMSIGYPPTHRTAATTSNDWVYWYNNWVTYRVVFDEGGKVSQIVGSPAPTSNQPIKAEAPPPPPAKKAPPKKKR